MPVLKVKRNNNGIGAPEESRRAVPVDLELAALDDLGPMTRAAICNGALPALAYSITSQIIELNDKIEVENVERKKMGLQLRPYLDPKEPRLDRNLAIGVFDFNAKLILTDGTEEGARDSLKVLVARPSGKSARERRKTEGRRFRGW